MREVDFGMLILPEYKSSAYKKINVTGRFWYVDSSRLLWKYNCVHGTGSRGTQLDPGHVRLNICH
jgi:hypothetical protein